MKGDSNALVPDIANKILRTVMRKRQLSCSCGSVCSGCIREGGSGGQAQLQRGWRPHRLSTHGSRRQSHSSKRGQGQGPLAANCLKHSKQTPAFVSWHASCNHGNPLAVVDVVWVVWPALHCVAARYPVTYVTFCIYMLKPVCQPGMPEHRSVPVGSGEKPQSSF